MLGNDPSDCSFGIRVNILEVETSRSHGSMENRSVHPFYNQWAVLHSPRYKEKGTPGE